METIPVHTMNTCRVLSESRRIIRANNIHFVALSLFFLPLSLITNQLFTVYQKPQIHHIIYMLIVNIFTLCATAMISYITNLFFFGEPLTLFASLKSLTSSFFPLFWTAIVTTVLLFFISLTFLMFVGVILMLVQNLRFVVIDYNSICFMWFSLVVVVVLIVIMIYFHITWSLASVVESKSGFTALMRSSYLVKGMRSVSLLILLYFGILGAAVESMYSANILGFTMLATFFKMMFLLQITAATTVLYNYCKTLHGELPIQTAQGIYRVLYIP